MEEKPEQGKSDDNYKWRMSRRAFLKLAAAGAGGFLTACGLAKESGKYVHSDEISDLARKSVREGRKKENLMREVSPVAMANTVALGTSGPGGAELGSGLIIGSNDSWIILLLTAHQLKIVGEDDGKIKFNANHVQLTRPQFDNNIQIKGDIQTNDLINYLTDKGHSWTNNNFKSFPFLEPDIGLLALKTEPGKHLELKEAFPVDFRFEQLSIGEKLRGIPFKGAMCKFSTELSVVNGEVDAVAEYPFNIWTEGLSESTFTGAPYFDSKGRFVGIINQLNTHTGDVGLCVPDKDTIMHKLLYSETGLYAHCPDAPKIEGFTGK